MLGIVIAGFSGVGKTTLSKKYKNVIDLDSAEFVYDDSEIMHIDFEARKGMDRKPNPNWPQNYINAIKNAMNNYDFVLVWDRPDALEEYKKNNIKFWFCYPEKSALSIYKNRYLNRGNTKMYVEKKINQYNENIDLYEKLDNKKIILKGNETLEDYLIQNKFHLVN